MTSLSLSLYARVHSAVLNYEKAGAPNFQLINVTSAGGPKSFVKKYFDLSMCQTTYDGETFETADPEATMKGQGYFLRASKHGQAQERKQKYVAKGWVVKDKK